MGLYVKNFPVAELEFQMFVMDELADALSEKGHDVIKLTIGISELPVPENVIRVFSETLHDSNKTRLVYPQGLPELRSAIADYYRTHFKVKAEARHVVINVGTSALFRNLFQLLCKPGQHILMPKPYYCLYLMSAILAEAQIRHYDIDLHTGRLNLDSFRQVYDPEKTAVVILNNPGNPIGNVLTHADIAAMNDIIGGRSFVIHDEIYNNTMFYEEYASPPSYLDKHLDTHIITNGFSKGFRMYTKRVGYAILPEPLIMPMRIMQQHTLLTCDPVNQYGMIEALKDLESPRELMVIYRDRAEYTSESLRGTGCVPIVAKGGFYNFLDCEAWIRNHGMQDSKDLARDILEKVHVSTVPGTDFGVPLGLRLSFCNGRYKEGVDRLRDYFTH